MKELDKVANQTMDKKTTISYYLICFFILSVIGWLIEVTESFLRLRIFDNRGFMFGPFVPIYAFGALLIYFTLRKLVKKQVKVWKINVMPLFLFIVIVIVTTALEYAVSWFLEIIFDRTWWYYGYESFQLHGRIMLKTSLFFGVAGLLYLYIVEPIMKKMLLKLKKIQLIFISIVLMSIFMTDIVISIIGHWTNR